jgi:hypothetical protein
VAEKISLKIEEETSALYCAIGISHRQLSDLLEARKLSTKNGGVPVDNDWLFERLREADESLRQARGRLMTLRGLRYSKSLVDRARES